METERSRQQQGKEQSQRPSRNHNDRASCTALHSSRMWTDNELIDERLEQRVLFERARHHEVRLHEHLCEYEIRDGEVVAGAPRRRVLGAVLLELAAVVRHRVGGEVRECVRALAAVGRVDEDALEIVDSVEDEVAPCLLGQRGAAQQVLAAQVSQDGGALRESQLLGRRRQVALDVVGQVREVKRQRLLLVRPGRAAQLRRAPCW